jgi:cytochrome c-type biogenesis protein CcmH/NrfG
MAQIGEQPNFPELKQAIEQYREQVADKPEDVRLLTNLAWGFERSGSFAEAIEGFKNALRVDPNHIDAHYGLGLALLESGQIPSALEAFTRARTLASRSEDQGYVAIVHHHIDVFFRRYGAA